MEEAELELSWLQNLQKHSLKSANQSLQYFSENPEFQKKLKTWYSYKMLIEKLKNISSLHSAEQELFEDFNEVLCLLFLGHYKSSLLVLRSHLELFNRVIRSVKDGKGLKKFLKEDRSCFKTKSLNVSENWKNNLNDLYHFLSKITHSDGYSFSHSQYSSLPIPCFSGSSFETCIEKIHLVISHNSQLMKVHFEKKWNKPFLGLNLFKITDYEKDNIEYLFENIFKIEDLEMNNSPKKS